MDHHKSFWMVQMLSYPFVFKECFSSVRSFLISPSRWMPLTPIPFPCSHPGRCFNCVQSEPLISSLLIAISTSWSKSLSPQSRVRLLSFPHSISPERHGIAPPPPPHSTPSAPRSRRRPPNRTPPLACFHRLSSVPRGTLGVGRIVYLLHRPWCLPRLRPFCRFFLR